MKSNRVITFLQRKGARETWEYERVVILLLELVCLVAGVIASPSHTTMLLMAIDLPRSLYATELARAVRSGAARKAERARAMGIPEVELACSRDIERAAKNQQLMTAAQPVVGLALSVAGSGQGFTRAIIVGFIVSVIRWASVEVYGVWRAWYRERAPVQVTGQILQLVHSTLMTARMRRLITWQQQDDDALIAHCAKVIAQWPVDVRAQVGVWNSILLGPGEIIATPLAVREMLEHVLQVKP